MALARHLVVCLCVCVCISALRQQRAALQGWAVLHSHHQTRYVCVCVCMRVRACVYGYVSLQAQPSRVPQDRKAELRSRQTPSLPPPHTSTNTHPPHTHTTAQDMGCQLQGCFGGRRPSLHSAERRAQTQRVKLLCAFASGYRGLHLDSVAAAERVVHVRRLGHEPAGTCVYVCAWVRASLCPGPIGVFVPVCVCV